MLEVNELREMLEYNESTGVLKWKHRPISHFKTIGAYKTWNSTYAGKETGCPDKHGYLRINIRGTPYLAHQLAFAIHHGRFVSTIDHINCIPSDNRISNLRECTKAQNQHNRTISKNNTSGFKGVCWHKQNKKWRAYIVVNWKQKHLGLFDNPEDAHAAYCAAADVLHKEFANHGSVVASSSNTNT